MPLAPDSKLGPYEILAALGAGGMPGDLRSLFRVALGMLGINTSSALDQLCVSEVARLD